MNHFFQLHQRYNSLLLLFRQSQNTYLLILESKGNQTTIEYLVALVAPVAHQQSP